jgi:hypothetical protein
MRDAGSHAEAEPEALSAYRAIGIAYPVLDWPGAWEAVRTHVVEALDAVREELTAAAEQNDKAEEL